MTETQTLARNLFAGETAVLRDLATGQLVEADTPTRARSLAKTITSLRRKGLIGRRGTQPTDLGFAVLAEIDRPKDLLEALTGEIPA